jgi:hypothetical protein
MDWIRRVEEIIAANPEPYVDRLHLPPRPKLLPGAVGIDAGELLPKTKRARLEESDGDQPQPKALRLEQKTPGKKPTLLAKSGIKAQKEAMQYAHRRFFYSMVAECATRGRGLLVELARDGPDGDFAYCDYRWSEREQLAFHSLSRVPATVHTLPAHLPVVCIFYCCKSLESGFTGPKLTDSGFRRLDMSAHSRIVITDISGPDTTHTGDINDRPALAIVPSEDLRPTLTQRALMRANRDAKISSQNEWEKHTPAISHLLNRGMFISQYCLPNMPLSGACDWGAVRDMLNTMLSAQRFQHPVGFVREAAPYLQMLKEYNQHLADYWSLILEGKVEDMYESGAREEVT